MAGRGLNLVFIGAPGVGKGTYGKRVCKMLNLVHCSTGDIIRDEIKAGTTLGNQISSYANEGKLVPDSVITDVMRNRLKAQDMQSGYLLDGFPRTVPQAVALDDMTRLSGVYELQLRRDVLIEKACARRLCSGCGENFNIADIRRDGFNMPPMLPQGSSWKKGDDESLLKCHKCGGGLVQRSDDTEPVVKNRLAVYEKETMPLVDYYQKQGKLHTFCITSGTEEMMPSFIKFLEDTSGVKINV
eukprot:Rmarinus@m.28067